MRFALILALTLCAGTLQAADKVSVATLNCEFLSTRFVHVKYGLPFDEEFWTAEQKQTWSQPGYREARYRDAVKAVAAAVRRIDADVIVLTEVARVPKRNGEFVTPNDVTRLHDELKETYSFIVYGDSSDTYTNQNVAVLSRRKFIANETQLSIPGREGYYGELDDVDSEAETTLSKGLRTAVRVDGQVVYLFPIHLKSERGGHEADAQRIAQASIVRRNCLKLLSEGRHVIVAGDLNDHRGQPTLRRLRGFDDLFEDFVQTGGPLFFRRRGSESTADFNARIRNHWTYEYNGQRQQIDHILISQSIRNHCSECNFHKRMQIEFLDVTETIAETEHPATDHRAVKLTLEFLDEHP